MPADQPEEVKAEKKSPPVMGDFLQDILAVVPVLAITKIIELANSKIGTGSVSLDRINQFKKHFEAYCRKHQLTQHLLPSRLGHFIVEYATIDRAWLDYLMKGVVIEYLTSFPDPRGKSAEYASLLAAAIQSRLTITAGFMIKQGLGVHGTTVSPSGEADFIPLFYAILYYDESLFTALLDLTLDVNHTSRLRKTALYLAVLHNEPAARDQLLLHPEIDMRDQAYCSLYDFVRFSPDNFKRLARKLASTLVTIEWGRPLRLPIAFLNEMCQSQLREALLEKIVTLPVFIKNPALILAMLAFIDNPRRLPFARLNRLAVAVECVQFVIEPSLVDNGGTNLCGPAVVMQYLLLYNPEKFIYATLELAELPKRGKHLPPCMRTCPQVVLETAYHLGSVWLETIRHNFNTVLGYAANSRLELVQGMTTPRDLITMLSEFGFSITAETLQIQLNRKTSPGLFFDGVRKKTAGWPCLPFLRLHDGTHVEIQDDSQRFAHLLTWMGKHPDHYVPALLDTDLVGRIRRVKATYDSVLKIWKYLHCVNITNVCVDEQKKTVSLDCLTYGERYKATQIPLAEFEKGFLGAVYIHHVAKPEALLSSSATEEKLESPRVRL